MMDDLLINLNEKENIISGYNFAKRSDVIFSEILTHEQYSDISDKNKLSIVYKNNDLVFYINRDLIIKENDIIFSTTHFVEDLFQELDKIKNLNNIKLITHQSDEPITKNLFNKKPKCISKWYSTNVDYKNENLIPIPLGISNNPVKNPMKKDFSKIKINNDPEMKMYINFQINTNYKEREKIYKKFVNRDWTKVDKPSKSLDIYIKKLNQYKFILCPWGNGYDTHRFWEALYAGSIPITKYHVTYNSAKDLPVIFIDNYKDINLNILKDSLGEINNKKINYEKITLNYWMTEISKDIKKDKNIEVKVFFNQKRVNEFITNFHKKNKKESNKKIILFRLRQIKNFIFKIN